MESIASVEALNDRWRRTALFNAMRVVTLLALSLVLAVPALADHDDDDGPRAAFTWSPSQPVEGEPVTFRSTSTRGDEPIIGQAWDLDNDGHYDDGTAPTATRVFSDDRSYTVSLGVVDADGEIDLEWRSISIAANRPPTASFNASTTSPLTGQSVTLTSTSSDPDGRPVIQAWDVDGDGAYDDATGASASLSSPDDGTRQVALRVTDSGGAQHRAPRPSLCSIALRSRALV